MVLLLTEKISKREKKDLLGERKIEELFFGFSSIFVFYLLNNFYGFFRIQGRS